MIDHEITILKSSGFSIAAMAKPGIWVSLCYGVTSLFFMLYLLPFCEKEYKNVEYEMKSTYALNLIEPGVFYNTNDFTVFIQEKNKDGYVKGIFISDTSNKSVSKTLFADEGFLKTNENGLDIFLLNGVQQERNENTKLINFLHFKENKLLIPIEKYTLFMKGSY